MIEEQVTGLINEAIKKGEKVPRKVSDYMYRYSPSEELAKLWQTYKNRNKSKPIAKSKKLERVKNEPDIVRRHELEQRRKEAAYALALAELQLRVDALPQSLEEWQSKDKFNVEVFHLNGLIHTMTEQFNQ